MKSFIDLLDWIIVHPVGALYFTLLVTVILYAFKPIVIDNSYYNNSKDTDNNNNED